MKNRWETIPCSSDLVAGGGRSSSLNFGLKSVGFLHFPASTGGSSGWDRSGWKEEDGTVLLGPVPPRVVAGCGGGGPKTAAVNSNRGGCSARRREREREKIWFYKKSHFEIFMIMPLGFFWPYLSRYNSDSSPLRVYELVSVRPIQKYKSRSQTLSG